MALSPYVEALLCFTAIYVLGRYLTKSISSHRPRINLPKDAVILLWALITALVSAVVRLAMPVGRALLPFEFQLSHFTQYTVLFSAGTVAARNSWIASISIKRGLGWFMLAPIALALCFSAALILRKIPILNKII